MKILIFFMMLSATTVFGQQTEGLKTQKTTKASIMERKLPEKSKDSLAKSNFKSILKKDNSNSVFGTANPYNSEIQMNVNRLQNNVNTFNNNTFNRMMPQGEGIQFNKRK
ncbi:hypothetical protein [Chryseobacterium salviniae]|uniref:Uncharacterized protein n=1 Tax=Chryseobacterium salviniae TaxID=3101750 RepID=A0ABU6HYM7_9FLAO|nr:hypothetical protein [Chryseobacterium sp. T9W2-O]MEC3877587.1 hypothetical protein [Chryseobacterium sp. T9W2-O]